MSRTHLAKDADVFTAGPSDCWAASFFSVCETPELVQYTLIYYLKGLWFTARCVHIKDCNCFLKLQAVLLSIKPSPPPPPILMDHGPLGTSLSPTASYINGSGSSSRALLDHCSPLFYWLPIFVLQSNFIPFHSDVFFFMLIISSGLSSSGSP